MGEMMSRRRETMSTELKLDEKLLDIAQGDGRYHPEAYRFIFDSLDFVLYAMGRQESGPGDRHITVTQLLEGIRAYALEQFGPLSRIVFESWGLYRTEDIGEIVFNLVEGGLLNKQDSDHKADFANGFSFQQAFEETFVPDIP